MPASMDTNSSQAYAAEETVLGVASTQQYTPLEPNSYSSWGVTTDLVKRSTINLGRQQAKGTIGAVNAQSGFQSDFTQTNLYKIMQGFFYADIAEKPNTTPVNGAATAISAVTANGYTLPQALAGVLPNHLIYTKGFTSSANNGLSKVTGVNAGAIASSRTMGQAYVAEAAPPAAASLAVVGFQLSNAATLQGLQIYPTSLADANTDFTTLGLSVGEWIYVGTVGNATPALNFNFVGNVSGVIVRGYARISQITQHTLYFDFATFGGLNGDASATAANGVHVFFGSYLQNRQTLATIKHRSYTLARYLGKGVNNTDQMDTMLGQVPDKFTLNIESATKLTADLTFVGIKGATSNLNAPAGLIGPAFNETAFNTSQDIFASLLTIPNQVNTSLFAYALSGSFGIDNSAAVVRALGSAVGFDVSVGDFMVMGKATVYFSDVTALNAIQNNADAGYTNIFAKANAGMVFDIPLVELGGGELKMEKDKKIQLDLTADGAINSGNYVASYTRFPFLPSCAMSNYTGL